MSQSIATIDSAAHSTAAAATTLVAQAEKFEVTTRQAFGEGAGMLRRIAELAKALEDKRLRATGPLNVSLREINDWFRGPKDALDKAKRTLSNALAQFEQQERQRKEEEERQAKDHARAQAEELARRAEKAAAKGDHERADELLQKAVEVKPERVDIIAPKAAGVTFSEHWEAEVVDEALIPREFLTPDLKKIGQYARAMKGSGKIPGVRIFSRPKVPVRT